MVFKDLSRRKQSCPRLVILLALVSSFPVFRNPAPAQLRRQAGKSNLTISYTQEMPPASAFKPVI